LDLPEAPGELHRPAAGATSRVAPVQPALGTRISSQAGLPAPLEVQRPVGSEGFPPPMDDARDAREAGPDDAVRSPASSARSRAARLVQAPRALRAGRYRGVQQQGPNHATKSLRLPNLRTRRNCPVPCARRATRTRLAHPQIRLRRRKCLARFWLAKS